MINLRSVFVALLVPLLLWQSASDTIRQRYEAAEAARAAGDLKKAEVEYTAILAEGYERLGQISLAKEDPENAAIALESAIVYRPNSAASQISLAIAYFDLEKYDRVVDLSRKVLVLDPQNSGAHQMLGKSYFMLGDLSKSVSELEEANRLAPNDIDVLYTLGIAYLRNRQNVEARRLYDSLLQQSGDNPRLHVLVGRAYRQSGLMSEAEAEFKKAITLDEHCPRAHYYLGITYLLDQGQSRIADALREFTLELAQNPDDYLANYYLGVVYVFQREWEPAVKVLEKAASIEPNNPDPYFQLGQAYQELNQHERAVVVLRKAIDFNPDLGHNKGQVTTAHHRLAQSLIKLGQKEAGQKELQLAADLKTQAFKLDQEKSDPSASLSSDNANSIRKSLPKSIMSSASEDSSSKNEELNNAANYYKKIVATAHNNLGLLRAQQQDFVLAASHFARAMQWNPQQEGLAFNLGLAYYKSRLYELAIAPLEQELKIHPENRAARVLLGLSCFNAELYAKTSELLGPLSEAIANDSDSTYALATALIRQGKLTEAEPIIEKLKTSAPASTYFHLLLAELYLARGEPNKGLSELAQTNLPRGVRGIHYNAGMIYARFDKPAEAAQQFGQELEVTPDDIASKYQLARILSKGKSSQRSLELLREIIITNPDHYAARTVLGEIFLKQRNFPAAIENLEAAVKLKPEDAEVHYQLAQAYIGAGRKTEGNNELAIAQKLRGKNGGNQK
jgi:tetratricopeptide (TPR) repeat protein